MKEKNHRLAAIFRSMADLLSSQRANPYRVQAYRRAADALLAIEEDVSTVADRQGLEEIDGIGTDLAKKIEEFLATGTIRAYEELKTPLPPEVQNWVTLPDLDQLVRSHLIRTLPNFSGSEEQLLQAVQRRMQNPGS